MTHEWRDFTMPKHSYREIITGGHPVLYWAKGEPHPEVGDEIVVYGPDKLTFTIDALTVSKKTGATEAIYTIHESRGRYLSRQPGYTSSPAMSIDREAPAVEQDVVNGWAEEAAERNQRHQEAKRKADPKRYERGVIDRLRATLKGMNDTEALALLEGVDASVKGASAEHKKPNDCQ